jgi:hypothetical protein
LTYPIAAPEGKLNKAVVFHLRASFLFVLALPFSFFPRVFDGDTQPWPLLAAMILVISSKTARRLTSVDVVVLCLVTFAIMGCFARAGFSDSSVRFAYKLMSFAAFWLCARSVSTKLVAQGMKMVIAIWFLVGLYQTVAIAIGMDVLFAGRIVVGRSGVSSLTPEPSLYGMLSIVALLYLFLSKEGARSVYVFMAFANVFLSGSFLAMIASLFVVAALSFRAKIAFLMGLAPVMFFAVSILDFQFLNRVLSLWESGLEWQALLLDYSINLRIGHIVYTLGPALLFSLVFLAPLSFEEAYNVWARSTSTFFPTGSNFILTSMGDVIYSGGIFGLGLLIVFLVSSYRRERRKPWIKVFFIVFLMLTQIGFASMFLVLFGLQEKRN